MILASNDYGCSDEVITIAAVLSVQVSLFATFPQCPFVFASNSSEIEIG